MFYHLILYIKIIYYLLSIIINNSNNINGNNTNKFQIQKPQKKKKKTSTNQQTRDEKTPTQTQPTNQTQPTIGLKPQPNQPKTSTHNPYNADPKRWPKTHIETHPKSHTHNSIKRDLKVGGEGCGCRRRGLKHKAARSTVRCGEWGGEIAARNGEWSWATFLSKEEREEIESDRERKNEIE